MALSWPGSIMHSRPGFFYQELDMCGSITFYGFNGKVREVCRYVAREDFIEAILDAIDDGERISYKVTSLDKSFTKKTVEKIIADEYEMYDASAIYSEEAYERMYEEQRESGYTYEQAEACDELPF